MRQQARVLRKEKHENMLEWIDDNKIADKSDNETWWDKSKDIGERRETEMITRQGQAIETKMDITK